MSFNSVHIGNINSRSLLSNLYLSNYDFLTRITVASMWNRSQVQCRIRCLLPGAVMPVLQQWVYLTWQSSSGAHREHSWVRSSRPPYPHSQHAENLQALQTPAKREKASSTVPPCFHRETLVSTVSSVVCNVVFLCSSRGEAPTGALRLLNKCTNHLNVKLNSDCHLQWIPRTQTSVSEKIVREV